MKPKSTEDIFELLDGYITSAVLGTAIELGLFWLLAKKPLHAPEVARNLNIPLNRCQNWLLILCKIGLLEDSTNGFYPSTVTQESILDVYSQDTWAYLARQDRYKFPAIQDLALNICHPISTWKVQNLTPPDYFKQIIENPIEADQFTRMLYEIHLPLAEQLSNILNIQGVKKLMDLGGGSGVISLALLHKHPDLTSVVVDVENVCRAGQDIARENTLETRITYTTADFLKDDLPTGFDMVIFCDVGLFSEILFRKIYNVLNSSGRLVIIGQLAQNKNTPAPSRLLWSFLGSLEYPADTINNTTIDMLITRLEQVGFHNFLSIPVPYREHLRWNRDWIMLEARK